MGTEKQKTLPGANIILLEESLIPSTEKTKLTEVIRKKNKEIILSIANGIREVTSDLNENYQEIIEFAVLIFERFGVEIDENEGKFHEMVALTIAICRQWKKGEIGQKKLYQAIILLLPEDKQSTLREREVKRRESLTPGTSVFMLGLQFPKIWRNIIAPELDERHILIHEIKKAYAKLDAKKRDEVEVKVVLHVAKESKDGIVYLPFEHFTSDASVHMLQETKRLLGIRRLSDLVFNASAWSDIDGEGTSLIIFPTTSPGKKTVAHEKNHVNFPGASVNQLGSSLNEAITEYLAREEVYPDVRPTSVRFIFSGAYHKEINLLNNIRKLDEGVFNDLVANYKDNSPENSRKVIQGLIKRFGIKLYLDLYLANPHFGNIVEDESRKVDIKTRDVNIQIRQLLKQQKRG